MSKSRAINLRAFLVDLGNVQRKAIEFINSDLPAEHVPDHIAIPRLNQLEREQIELEAACGGVRRIVYRILDAQRRQHEQGKS